MAPSRKHIFDSVIDLASAQYLNYSVLSLHVVTYTKPYMLFITSLPFNICWFAVLVLFIAIARLCRRLCIILMLQPMVTPMKQRSSEGGSVMEVKNHR